MFEVMTQQTTLRPNVLESNNNISFPVGTAFAVKKYSQKLDFDRILFQFKKRGIDLASLIEALITYRLTENQSICRGSEWINRPDVLRQFDLSAFEERTLFRGLETVGDNYEEITFLVRESIFSQYEFPHTDVDMDWTSFVLWGKKQNLESMDTAAVTDLTRSKSLLVLHN